MDFLELRIAFDDVVADAALGARSLSTDKAATLALNTHFAMLDNDLGYKATFTALSKLGNSYEGQSLRSEIGKAADEPDPLMAGLKLAWAALQHPVTYLRLRYYQESLFAKAAPFLEFGATGR
ncbi:MAG: hypothetical protein KDJ50_05735 [Alphaproteobacteria bacterium]|nr:hypothetical protein [Alphaproteobacteria bacterium]